MSTRSYFVTEEEEEAKNWRMLKQRNAIKGKLARLDDEMKQFSASWIKLGRLAGSPDGCVFKFDEEEIFVVNGRGQPLERLPWRHFERGRIADLLTDLQSSRDEFEAADRNVKSLGIE
jgi:hypothetical protein